jgi:hypothetical protein
VSDSSRRSEQSLPLIVQYLYVHDPNEPFYYPSVRSGSSVGAVAARYLECALTQVASLRLQDARCELVLATNIGERGALGRRARELIDRIESFGVQILPTAYRHRPGDDSETYVSSRYVLDAILSAGEGQPEDRQMWLTDLDCVWVDPERIFAAAPPPGGIGCIHIPYPPDWDVVGFGDVGLTRAAIGELAQDMGHPGGPAPWVGGELLGGSALALRELVAVCEELDSRLASRGEVLPTEEQILTLAGALGRITFSDLSAVAARIQTGARHHSPPVTNPLTLGLWHLPSEKGLSLRRAANAVCRGRLRALRRDFAEPARTARRFNVAGVGRGRRIRDDAWIGAQRIASSLRRLQVR